MAIVKVISYEESKNMSSSKNPKQQKEEETKQTYQKLDRLQKNIQKQKISVLNDEMSKQGIAMPSQLKFSQNPTSTFVRNDNGTSTIKSPYDQEQDKIREQKKSYETQGKILRENPQIQALNEAYKEVNNQRLLAKYNYDMAKEDNHEITLYDRTIGVPIRAIKDALNFGAYDMNNTYVDENGNKMILPQDYQIRQEKVRNSYGDDFFGKIAKFGTDVGYNITKIGLSSAVNALAGGLPIGTAMYFGDMGMDNFNSAKLDGYDDASAALYSVIGVASEMVTERLLGGLAKNLKLSKGDSSLSTGINKALGKVMKNDKLRNVLSNALSEGTEEFVQEFIEKLNTNIVLKKEDLVEASENTFNDETLSDAVYSALVGMGSAGLMSVGNVIADRNGANKKVNTIINNNDNAVLPKANSNILPRAKNSITDNNISEAESTSNFSQQVDDYVNGTFPSRDMLTVLDHTPQVLQDIGLKDLPITLTQKHLQTIANKEGNYSNSNYHDLGIDVVKQIPEALNHPLNVLKSDTRNDSIVVVTELSDKNGNIVLASIKIDGKGYISDIYLDSNVMTSAYGKNNYDKFMKNNINKGNLLYDIDEGIIKKLDTKDRFQLPMRSPTSYMDNTTTNSVESQVSSNNSNMQLKGNDVSKYLVDNKTNYRGSHQIENAKSITEINLNDVKSKVTGANGYLTKQDTTDLNRLKKILANPNEMVKIYRASPVNELNSGDWVTTDKAYAQNVANNNGGKVYTYEVRAGQLYYPDNVNDLPSLHRLSSFQYVEELNQQTKNKKIKTNNLNEYIADAVIRENQQIEADKQAIIESIENYIADNNIKKPTIQDMLNSMDYYNMQDNETDITELQKAERLYREVAKDLYNNKYAKLSKDSKINENSRSSTVNNAKNNTLNENFSDNVIKANSKNKKVIRDTIKNNYENKVNKNTNIKESKFYKNATEKSKFITDDNRAKLSEIGDLKYYESISNKESLNKASKRIKENGTAEALRWMQQDNKTSDASDVAEGWILLKNYQDAGDFDSMVAVAKKMREIGTIAGQTVQAYNIMSRLTPEGMVKYAQSELLEAYGVYSKNKPKSWIDKNASKFDLDAQEVGFIVETMKQVQNMEDGRAKNVKLGEINKMLADKLPPEKGARIKAWMRISMLFNPKTQVRNVLGNTIIAPVNMAGDFFASGIDKLIAKKTGVRTTGIASIKNYLKGFKKGLYESYDDFKRGINTRNVDANRFELDSSKSFSNRNIIGRTLNRIDSLNSFLLDAGDRGFYEGSFTNSINNQLALNKTNKITQTMIDIATSEALQRTWQDNNNYTKFVLSTRNMLNKANIRGYGLGDILIPFAKTPANLTKAIVDYSPAGLVKTLIKDGRNLRNNIGAGVNTAIDQHKFVQSLGKGIAGTMLYVAAYGLAKAGIASGKSDDDKDTRDFIKNTLGISSYSIKIGDKSFTYDWAQPVAAPLSIMTNIVQSKNNKEQALLEAITSSLDSSGSILLEQSFLKSINEVLTDNDGIASGIENAILDLPARGIPTFMKQIVDMTDSTQRQTFEYDKPLETAINKIKAKLPGLSQTLSPSVDTMGREIQKYGGKNNIFNVFLNPANINTSNISEAAKEIYRVYKEVGDKTIMPRVAPYYINSKGQKTILNTEERKDFQKIAGEIIEDSVNELKDNRYYSDMSDTDRSEVINNVVNYAYNKARKDVLGMEMSNEYNSVNKWLEKGGTVAEYYANRDEANYSLKSPSRYNTITAFNIDYYDFEKYQKQVSKIKKEYNGTKYQKVRKQAVFAYINSVKATKAQKIVLFKLLGGYSIKEYQNSFYNAINGFKASAREKAEIWNVLFGKGGELDE